MGDRKSFVGKWVPLFVIGTLLLGAFPGISSASEPPADAEIVLPVGIILDDADLEDVSGEAAFIGAAIGVGVHIAVNGWHPKDPEWLVGAGVSALVGAFVPVSGSAVANLVLKEATPVAVQAVGHAANAVVSTGVAVAQKNYGKK